MRVRMCSGGEVKQRDRHQERWTGHERRRRLGSSEAVRGARVPVLTPEREPQASRTPRNSWLPVKDGNQEVTTSHEDREEELWCEDVCLIPTGATRCRDGKDGFQKATASSFQSC